MHFTRYRDFAPISTLSVGFSGNLFNIPHPREILQANLLANTHKIYSSHHRYTNSGGNPIGQFVTSEAREQCRLNATRFGDALCNARPADTFVTFHRHTHSTKSLLYHQLNLQTCFPHRAISFGDTVTNFLLSICGFGNYY